MANDDLEDWRQMAEALNTAIIIAERHLIDKKRQRHREALARKLEEMAELEWLWEPARTGMREAAMALRVPAGNG